MSKRGKYTDLAKEFHKKHIRGPYTMTPNAQLEAKMLDAALSKETRLMAFVERYSWGNYSELAVDALPRIDPEDPTPKPMTQDKAAEMLSLAKSSISEAVANLKEQGYLKKHQFLYPIRKVTPLESVKTSGVSSGSTNLYSSNLRPADFFFSKRPDLAKILSDSEEIRKTAREKALEATRTIHKVKLQELAFERDLKRGKDPLGYADYCAGLGADSTENPNKTANPETSVDPIRYCTDVHIREEDKANKDMKRIKSYNGVSSDLQAVSFGTPSAEPVDSRTADPHNPNVSSKTAKAPLKHLINKEKESAAAAAVSTEQEPLALHKTPPPAADGLFTFSPDQETADSRDYEQLAVLATQYGIDGPGVDILVTNCRKVRADAIYPEIGHFLEIEAARYQKRGKKVQSLSGLLLTTGVVEANFKGRSFEQYRNRQRKAEQPAGKESETEPPKLWDKQGSWEGDKRHWNELDAETQDFYREMFREECPK